MSRRTSTGLSGTAEGASPALGLVRALRGLLTRLWWYPEPKMPIRFEPSGYCCLHSADHACCIPDHKERNDDITR